MGTGWTDTGYFTIVSNYVLEDTSLSAKARFLYMLLIRYGRWKKVGNELYLVTWVGRERLSELTGESSWSVSQRIGELCDKGLIERRRRTCTSSHTYICDPRSIYTRVVSIPSDDAQDDDDESYQTLDLGREDEAVSPTPANAGADQIAEPPKRPHQQPAGAKETQSPTSDSGVPPDNDADIQPAKIHVKYGTRNSTKRTNASNSGGSSAHKSLPTGLGAELKGVLAKRAENSLTTKSKSKIGIPDDAIAADEDSPESAHALWSEFQRAMLENHSGYSVPPHSAKELANCKKLLQEYAVGDLLGLFEMVATRWPVIMEKWPHLAKTPLPTFYVMFTLRRELIPLVQSVVGLTSRAHRFDSGSADKIPDIGWGDV